MANDKAPVTEQVTLVVPALATLLAFPTPHQSLQPHSQKKISHIVVINKDSEATWKVLIYISK